MIFRSLEDARGRFGPCALTIGNFDGVHIGHQALLAATASCAKENNLASAVLTFHPHPAAIVAPERMPQLISTLDQRLRLLASAGAERILILPFTQEVAHLSPGDFVWQILVNALNTKAIFVGENFRFGHKQSGAPETLKALGEQFGFTTRFLKPVSLRGQVVSSSLIRHDLAQGSVSRAGRLLGRCFSIEGPVVPGRGIGSTQTVPTLNLRPVPGQIVPHGIYITETIDRENGRHWQSVTSSGTNPTFGATDLTIETFLLAPPFDGQTPQHIEVLFRRFLRPEETFPNAQALKAQILNDASRAQSYWRRILRYTD
ncbi:MAG: bifunctional riboflavin kinase/FAD synthetase [Bryobacteraceae bacterium]